jgi:hypothetical protein
MRKRGKKEKNIYKAEKKIKKGMGGKERHRNLYTHEKIKRELKTKERCWKNEGNK